MPMSPEHEALNFMINCPAWGPLYKKRLGEKGAECVQQLIDPSLTRKEKFTDDYLRGYIQALKWAARWPEQEVEIAAMDQETS